MCSSEGGEDHFFFDLAPERAVGPRIDKLALLKSSAVLPDDWHLGTFSLSDITNNRIYNFECKVGSAPPAPMLLLLASAAG